MRDVRRSTINATEVVAAGRLRHTWRIAVSCLYAGAVLGTLFGLCLALAYRDDDPGAHFLAGLALFLLAALGAAPICVLGWGLWSGRVRYVVAGTHIVAYRGRRKVRDVDASEFDEIQLGGEATWRDLLLPSVGYILTVFEDLPHLMCVKNREDRLIPETVTFPRVLVWGAAGANDFHDALTTALKRNGVTTPVISVN